jgi:hypothetical protein
MAADDAARRSGPAPAGLNPSSRARGRLRLRINRVALTVGSRSGLPRINEHRQTAATCRVGANKQHRQSMTNGRCDRSCKPSAKAEIKKSG